MQAALMNEAGKIEIRDRPDPVPEWSQVLIRIQSAGVCGSDRHLFTHGGIGDLSIDAPLILGPIRDVVITALAVLGLLGRARRGRCPIPTNHPRSAGVKGQP